MLTALTRQVGGDHYKTMAIEPLEFSAKNKLGFCEGSVVKYTCRHREKGGAEDLKKAVHYLQVLLEQEYGEQMVLLEADAATIYYDSQQS